MATARVFKSGNSQAVRLPKEFRFDVDEVEVTRRGDDIILSRPKAGLAGLYDALIALGELKIEIPDDPPPAPVPSFDGPPVRRISRRTPKSPRKAVVNAKRRKIA